MTSTFKRAKMDYAASMHNIGKAGFGTLMKALIEAHDNRVAAAHDVPDLTNLVTAAGPSDLATLATFLGDYKTQWNAHCAMTTGYHALGADVTNTMSQTPSDLANCLLTVNEAKADFNAHIILASGTGHTMANSSYTIATANATTLATAIALAIEVAAAYTKHRINALRLTTTLDAVIANSGLEGV